MVQDSKKIITQCIETINKKRGRFHDLQDRSLRPSSLESPPPIERKEPSASWRHWKKSVRSDTGVGLKSLPSQILRTYTPESLHISLLKFYVIRMALEELGAESHQSYSGVSAPSGVSGPEGQSLRPKAHPMQELCWTAAQGRGSGVEPELGRSLHPVSGLQT